MSSTRQKLVQTFAICMSLLVIYSFIASPPAQFFPTSDFCSTTNITIIPWNSYWMWPDYGIGEQNTGFLEHNCSYTNYFLSLNKSKIDTADVILVHGHELGRIKEDLIDLKNRRQKNNGWPLILYWNKESPM